MKKIAALVIITLFVITSFITLPGICYSSNAGKLNNIVSKDLQFSNKFITLGSPPLPPVVWTEDFINFYISVPQDPENDQVYYWIDWGDGTTIEWIGPYEPGQTIYLSHVWSEDGIYKIKAKAKDLDGESRCAKYTLSLSSDFKFFGIETGFVNITYTFTIYLNQQEFFIYIDWGDGNFSDWFGPIFETWLFPHAWSLPGKYIFGFRMKDIYGNESDWLTVMITILPIKNSAPKAPVITGPTGVKPRDYEYTFQSTDPDGDLVKYFIDWGDGNNSGWIGPYSSGEVLKLNHTFSKKRIYLIRAKAMDSDDYESKWGYLPVRISKSVQKTLTQLFLQVLKNILNYPIIWL